MDDIVRRPAVLLRHRDGRAGFQLGRRLLPPFELLSFELLQGQLLRSRSDVLRSRAHVLCSRCSHLLRSGPVLRSEALLRSQVLQDSLLHAQDQVLQEPLLQAELLRSGPELLRSGPDLRRSLRSDVRCSRGCLLQLV